MTFRSIHDLTRVISKRLCSLPKEIGIVAGIPRSGLLPATLIALNRNVLLTDVYSLLNGRVFQGGLSNRGHDRVKRWPGGERVLVVDDSVDTGRQMLAIKAAARAAGVGREIIYCAVYVTTGGKKYVDMFFEEVDGPRLFEWNYMHHAFLRRSCMNIDGILYDDPFEQEQEGSEKCAGCDSVPLVLPTMPVGVLVTSRPEKYRRETEAWLKYHQVAYGKLVMLGLTNTKEKNIHAECKAHVAKLAKAEWIIESDASQAELIAEESRKPVLCTTTKQMLLARRPD